MKRLPVIQKTAVFRILSASPYVPAKPFAGDDTDAGIVWVFYTGRRYISYDTSSGAASTLLVQFTAISVVKYCVSPAAKSENRFGAKYHIVLLDQICAGVVAKSIRPDYLV